MRTKRNHNERHRFPSYKTTLGAARYRDGKSFSRGPRADASVAGLSRPAAQIARIQNSQASGLQAPQPVFDILRLERWQAIRRATCDSGAVYRQRARLCPQRYGDRQDESLVVVVGCTE